MHFTEDFSSLQVLKVFAITETGAARKAPAAAGMIGNMIGRMHHVILDCPEPAALAAFYSALLGLPVTYDDGDFAVVAVSDTSSGLAFQRAPGNPPPTWPDPAVPQQFHLDVMVEDVAAAGPRVLALGARPFQDHDVSPRMVNGRSMERPAHRVASVMSMRPARRSAPIARLRRAAMILGPDRVLTWDLSS